MSCLFLCFGCIDQPDTYKNNINLEIDSARLILRYDSLCQLFREKNQDRYLDSATEVFNSVAIAKKYPNLVLNIYDESLRDQQGNFFNPDSLKTTIKYLKDFYRLATESNNEKLKVWYEYFDARFYGSCMENEIALPKYLAVYPKFVALKDTYGISVTTKRIGLIYLESTKEYSKARDYFLKAYAIANTETEIEINKVLLLKTYLELNKPDSALIYLSNLNTYKHYQDEANLLYNIYLYANTEYGSIDSVNKYFYGLEKYDYTYNRDFHLVRMVSTFAKFSFALIEHNNFELAKKTIDRGLNYDRMCNFSFNERLDLYKARYNYYYDVEDYKNAYHFLDVYNEAANRLKFDKTKSDIEAAKVKFEFENQKKEAQAKQDKERLTNEHVIQSQKIIRNIVIAGSILLVIIAFLLVNRYRMKRKFEMEKMRSRLSRDLHDDIGSTLSSINILSRTAQSNLNQTNDEKTKASLEKINERSQRLLDNMSDIIWNINPGNDTIEEVMSRMREYATTIFEAKNIDYTFDFPKEKMDCKLSMEVKNNMYLIFKEAVNNLSKYSGASKVNLSLTFDEKNIHLKVEDNGKGFNEDEIKHRGGLSNMQHRAEEIKGAIKINSVIDKGTVIELSMPRYC